MSKKEAITQAPAEDPLAAARAEVVRLNSHELRLAVLYRVKTAELISVRAERGDQVLDAADPLSAARQVGQRGSALLEELEALADASKRARERRLAAIPAVYQAEADAAERKAAQLEADAANLEAESDRLRKALQAHDDWTYVAAEPVAPERMLGGKQQGGAPIVVDARGPRHKRLRHDAQVLRSQAAQGRYKVAHQAGMLEADTVEDLFAAVHSDPMRIGPPVDAIVSWAEQAIAKERARRARVTSGDGFVAVDAPMGLHLEWRAGAIDASRSWIVQPEAPEVRAYFDSASELEKVSEPVAALVEVD